jgi:hypothetical protein
VVPQSGASQPTVHGSLPQPRGHLRDLSEYDDAQQACDDAARLVRETPRTADFCVRGRLANEHAALGDRYTSMDFTTRPSMSTGKRSACPTFPTSSPGRRRAPRARRVR